jgi:GNAT acetyltransferase-like protein
MRDSIRKARHRIDDRGGAEIRVATGSGVAAAFDGYVALEAAGGRRQRDRARPDAMVRDTLRDYLLACHTAQVRSLHVDGRLAASQFGVCVAGVLSLMYVT